MPCTLNALKLQSNTPSHDLVCATFAINFASPRPSKNKPKTVKTTQTSTCTID